MKITKKQIEAFIREQIGTDLKWAMRAAIVLYNRQTSTEQGTGRTIIHNGQGFTAFDAEKLTPIARKCLHGSALAWWEKEKLKKNLPKYAKQIHYESARLGKESILLSQVQLWMSKEHSNVDAAVSR